MKANLASARPCLFITYIMDTYTTLTSSSETQLTEKRSRFLAFAIHVDSEEEAKSVVASYKKKYYDARHVCYAYVIGNKGETTRANDDGEPSGTAGRPILGQIQSRQLTYTLGIVVRYFGGVKLGIGPLGVAYKTAIGEALDAADKEEKIITTVFRVSVPYTEADVAMRFIRDVGATIQARDYDERGTILTVDVRMDDEQTLREKLSKILTLQFIKEDEQ